jgi:hypothetical protein
MSAEARAPISAAMKKRWAARKRAAKTMLIVRSPLAPETPPFDVMIANAKPESFPTYSAVGVPHSWKFSAERHTFCDTSAFGCLRAYKGLDSHRGLVSV